MSKESDYAIAGRVSVKLHLYRYILLLKMRALSHDGLCKALETHANGYVAGNGVGALLLQRLNDAIKEGNYIHGILISTPVYHIGKSLDLDLSPGAMSACNAQQRLFQTEMKTISS